MIDVKVDFRPDDLEKMVVEAMKKDIKKQLRSAGVRDVTVKFTRERGEMSFTLSGPDDQIEKASQALDL